MFVKRFYATPKVRRFTMRRNGTNANPAIASFTPQSATASDTQSGTVGPMPKSGRASFAQLTSFIGSIKVSAWLKAMEKNRAVSRVDPDDA